MWLQKLKSAFTFDIHSFTCVILRFILLFRNRGEKGRKFGSTGSGIRNLDNLGIRIGSSTNDVTILRRCQGFCNNSTKALLIKSVAVEGGHKFSEIAWHISFIYVRPLRQRCPNRQNASGRIEGQHMSRGPHPAAEGQFSKLRLSLFDRNVARDTQIMPHVWPADDTSWPPLA